MGDLIIRPAAESDAPTIAAIYNHYVRTSTATFDTQERSIADQVAWLADHTGPYPALVAETSEGVVAWGALSAWGTRCAYRHTVEISVYVTPDEAGHGIGPALSQALIERARELRHHAVISQIVHENAPSLAMSRRLGFEHVGTLREVGRKFDRWLDVVLMELVLDTAADAAGDAGAVT
jgi:L-amino acid N-acyltransferase YncA